MSKTTLAQPPRPTPILFTHYGDNWLRGSELCLLSLLRTLDKTQFQPIVWTNNSLLAMELKRLNIPVYQAQFTVLFGWQQPKADLINFIRLVWQGVSLVRRHNIQLLHANSAAPVQWLSWVARCCRLPLVAHLHSIYSFRDRLTLGLYNASVCVGVSQAVIAPLRDDGLSPERYRLIYNGINTSTPLAPLSRMIFPEPRPFVIATIGSLIRRKGVDLLLNACAHLKMKRYRVQLLVFGDGPERKALIRRRKEFGLEQEVRFFGDTPNAAAYLHHGVDAYVSGARDEAFGLVLAEAGLAKLPVIAPDVGGISEVVSHHHSGILVKPNNSEAISQAIAKLIRQPQWAKQLGHNGRARVLEQFTCEQMTQQFETLYQQVLATPEQRLSWLDVLSLPKHWLKALWRRRRPSHPHRINKESSDDPPTYFGA